MGNGCGEWEREWEQGAGEGELFLLTKIYEL